MRAFPLALVGLLFTFACGYHLAARPRLPGDFERVQVQMFQNDTSELEIATIVSAALSRRIARDDRLAKRGNSGAARLTGRVRHPRTSAVAFPPALGGAGLYTQSLVVEVQLRGSEGRVVTRIQVAGDEPFEAGAGPEETEANRRRALDRLADRLADEAWSAILGAASR